jgi:aromatic-L-amino-acid decarboxylase
MEHTKLDELIRDASTKLNESFENIDSMKQWKTQMFTLINEIAELKLASSPRVVTKINTSLDPADWSSTRSVTHKLLDSLLNFIETVRDRPVWVPIPTDVRVTLESESLPENGQSLSDVCQHVLNYVLPYSLGNTHPRFWGWVMGEGTIGGVLAEMIAATINANIGGRTQASVLVERTVIKWMRQLFGFPEGNTAGLVTTGTSMSTVISLATARQRTIGYVRKDGLVDGAQLVAYASTEVHICVPKALELLGIGSNALRRVSVDENFLINTDELKRRIQLDRDNGFIPFCIIGNAGKSHGELYQMKYSMDPYRIL